MGHVFGLHSSKCCQGLASLSGVVAAAIQIGNHLFFARNVMLALRHGFVGECQVLQFHLSIHEGSLRHGFVSVSIWPHPI